MQIDRTRGDTTPIVATVTFKKTRQVVNLVGCSFKLTVDKRAAPADVSTLLFQIEGVVAEGENGQVEFHPTDEQANHVGFFYYDIQMTDSYGKIHTLVCDSFVIKQDITK